MAVYDVESYQTMVGDIAIATYDRVSMGRTPYPATTIHRFAGDILPYMQGDHGLDVEGLAERLERPGFYIASLISKQIDEDMPMEVLAFAELDLGKPHLEFVQLGVTSRVAARGEGYMAQLTDRQTKCLIGANVLLDHLIVAHNKREDICVVRGYDKDSRTDGVLEEWGLTLIGIKPWGTDGSLRSGSCSRVLERIHSY
jgi:hypothetical protein